MKETLKSRARICSLKAPGLKNIRISLPYIQYRKTEKYIRKANLG